MDRRQTNHAMPDLGATAYRCRYFRLILQQKIEKFLLQYLRQEFAQHLLVAPNELVRNLVVLLCQTLTWLHRCSCATR